MKKIISVQRTSQTILALVGVLILFHLMVIFHLIPTTWVWGNDMEEASILPLELIAIVVTFSFGLFTLIKMRYVKTGEDSKVVNIGLWLIAAFLLYTSVMNIISEVAIDNFFFAPITFVLTLLTVRLVIE
ncbi:MAG: hypothetical protein ACERKD_23235 [Prolixibacteraceae bacterium]